MKKMNNNRIVHQISFVLMLFVVFMSNNVLAQNSMEDFSSKDKFTLLKKWYEDAGFMINLNNYKDYYNEKFSNPAPEGSSAMHKKYNHQIVFSKEPIIYGKEDESKFTTDFKFGDNIYAMAYFSFPIKDFAKFDGYQKMSLIDRKLPNGNLSRGSNHQQYLNDLLEASKDKSYLSFYLIKPTTDTAFYTYSARMCYYFSQIYFRTNTQIFASILQDEALGVFNYDLSGTTEQTFKDMSGVFYKIGDETNAQQQETALNSLLMKKEWLAKSFPVTGGLTEATIKAEYISLNPEAKIAKLYASGGAASWIVDKDDYGTPIQQHYTQLIMLFCKDGKYCWYAEVVLKKDYLGGGKYGKVYAAFDSFNNTYLLPCSKMK